MMVKLRWFVMGSEKVREFEGLLEAFEFAIEMNFRSFEVDNGDGWENGMELLNGMRRLFL